MHPAPISAIARFDETTTSAIAALLQQQHLLWERTSELP